MNHDKYVKEQLRPESIELTIDHDTQLEQWQRLHTLILMQSPQKHTDKQDVAVNTIFQDLLKLLRVKPKERTVDISIVKMVINKATLLFSDKQKDVIDKIIPYELKS
jgi:hypothetical protein